MSDRWEAAHEATLNETGSHKRFPPAPATAPSPTHETTHAPGTNGRSAGRAAVHHLERSYAQFSCRRTLWPWQFRALALALPILAAALALAPNTAGPALLATLSIAFLLVAFVRISALATLAQRHQPATPPALDDDALPTYAVLVPLFKEAHVVPTLIDGLRRIDYPRARLTIAFIVEAIDTETHAALNAAFLDANVRIIVVPDGKPRTKPRALCYALAQTPGGIVTVYDAEDLPEPDQLRRAAALIAQSGPATGCVQARLNTYNPRQTWLTRQFTIEYTALFDAILPTLARLKIPVPLGGTSNHFPRAALEAAGGWDPYNVTEDADLGIRLARFGYKVRVLPSTTWEEAPASLSVWMGQRTRWMKGFMQTTLVHLREPARTFRELGPRGFAGFLVLMLGLVVSPLVHPWFFIALAAETVAHVSGVGNGADPGPGPGPGAALPPWLFWLGVVNLVLGYISAIALGAFSVARRGWRSLITTSLTMPIYWLLISFAAYRAALELITAPHHWEKTAHAAEREWPGPDET